MYVQHARITRHYGTCTGSCQRVFVNESGPSPCFQARRAAAPTMRAMTEAKIGPRLRGANWETAAPVDLAAEAAALEPEAADDPAPAARETDPLALPDMLPVAEAEAAEPDIEADPEPVGVTAAARDWIPEEGCQKWIASIFLAADSPFPILV